MLLERKISPCQITYSYKAFFSATPPNWKLLLKDGENNDNRIDKTVSDDVQDITRMTSKSIYSTLVKRIQISPTAQSKFNSVYNISGTIDWKNIYLLPGRVTLDTRTRAFPYKILNRILYTNKVLYKMNLVSSPVCTFCGDHEETIEHLLISCTYSKTIWLSVISWLDTYNMKIDKLDKAVILCPRGVFFFCHWLANNDYITARFCVMLGLSVFKSEK